MLPFLKNKREVAGSSSEPVELEGESFGMLDAIADDLLEAFTKKDKGLLKSALDSLVAHIQDMDADQDKTLT